MGCCSSTLSKKSVTDFQNIVRNKPDNFRLSTKTFQYYQQNPERIMSQISTDYVDRSNSILYLYCLDRDKSGKYFQRNQRKEDYYRNKSTNDICIWWSMNQYPVINGQPVPESQNVSKESGNLVSV